MMVAEVSAATIFMPPQLKQMVPEAFVCCRVVRPSTGAYVRRACVYVPRQRHSLTDLLSGFSYTCDWQLLHLLYVSVVNICSSDICQC